MKKSLPFHPRIEQFIAQLLQEIRLKRLLPSLTAGCILGILNVTFSISFAALIFSGELSGYVSQGIGFILFGAFVIGLVVSLTSSLSGTIAAPQDIPAAILALAAMTIVKSVPVSEGSEKTFVTLMAIIMLTSVLTGAIFFVLGALKLGDLTRFLPYPVIGGFLAGTGWLLLKGALYVMADMPLDLAHVPDLFQSVILIKWLPGVMFGGVLVLISRRYRHFLMMPMTIAAGAGLFFLVLALTNTSIADAEVRGWLLGPFPRGGLWQPFTLAEVKQIHWSAMTEHIGWNMGTIVLFGTIAVLLNAAGLELVARRDIDVNRELVSAGIGNILTGLSGGIVGYHSLSCTSLGHKIAPHSRLVGIFAAILSGVAVFFGASLLSLFPKFLAGSVLFFLGLSFLLEWVYDAWRTLPKTEYILILIILWIVATFGFMQGVLVGSLMTIIIFVVTYSRINVVKHTLSGRTFQSTVERAVVDRRILQENGEALVIFKLHGFIFFGTANTLYQQIRHSIIAPESSGVRFLVLDFHLVSGLDASALNSFAKLKQLAETQGITLVFTDLLPETQRQFRKRGYVNEGDQVVRIFENLDRGIEWCEEQILIAEESAIEATGHTHTDGKLLESAFDDIMKSLEQQERFEVVVEDLMPYLERQERLAGDYVIHQGELPEALYFIESGQVVVQFEDNDSKTARLRTLNAGTVVGELGIYLRQQTSASVIIQQPGTIYRLSSQALQRMKTTDPQKTIRFHEFMVHLLSERLVNTNNTLHALLD